MLILVFVAFVIGYYFSHAPSSQQQPKEEEKPTIASFEKEIDESVAPYLSMIIENYGITDKSVWCKGTVLYVGPEGYNVSGAAICMYIKKATDNSINVKVVLYSGLLLLPYGVIDSDSVSVPEIGIKTKTFYFELQCNYEK